MFGVSYYYIKEDQLIFFSSTVNCIEAPIEFMWSSSTCTSSCCVICVSKPHGWPYEDVSEVISLKYTVYIFTITSFCQYMLESKQNINISIYWDICSLF